VGLFVVEGSAVGRFASGAGTDDVGAADPSKGENRDGGPIDSSISGGDPTDSNIFCTDETKESELGGEDASVVVGTGDDEV